MYSSDGSGDHSRVAAAVSALRRGDMVIVTDDVDREDEADLVVAASKLTAEQMAFMVRYTTGIVCAPVPSEYADRLDLAPMTEANDDPHGTSFTVSVDHVAAGTGVSASDRTRTLRALADGTSRAEEFRRPGHIFPLRARPGGVLKRAGHTEATVDLLRLADLPAVGAISELVADSGDMLRGRAVRRFADTHGLQTLAIEELIRYRRATAPLVECTGQAQLPTRYGPFHAFAYRSVAGLEEHLCLTVGGPFDATQAVLTRVHSECLTGDGFGSLRCDCGAQLDESLKRIAEEGAGVVVYLRGQEGRGIGLGHKLRAYALQQEGHDTVDANLSLGFPIDDRDYGVGAQILSDQGVRRLRLLTNNPDKYSGLEGHDLVISERVALKPNVTADNLQYLRTKRDRMGHLLELGGACDEIGDPTCAPRATWQVAR